MRTIFPASLNARRVKEGPLKSSDTFGFCGAFYIPSCFPGVMLGVIASDGSDWVKTGLPPPIFEHASVRVINEQRLPTWNEMDYVKKIFWSDDEVVAQLHVNDERKVQHRTDVLHLWKQIGQDYSLPPGICI